MSVQMPAYSCLLHRQGQVHGSNTDTKEALWLRKLCSDIEIECSTIRILCNNQGAIKLSKHAISGQRSKHIDVAHHFIRERIMRREVALEYINTDMQIANFLTKPQSRWISSRDAAWKWRLA
jgi:hypothetical protein